MGSHVRTDASPRSYGRVRTVVVTRPYEGGNIPLRKLLAVKHLRNVLPAVFNGRIGPSENTTSHFNNIGRYERSGLGRRQAATGEITPVDGLVAK
ncbi:hypothetical protein [Bacteroides sp. Marseille-P3684]|uniref:hypothetical protein n=1 Tax=Bacteroides sp. Marseille-P3684 TaxID=2086579 RepID=UPI0013004342|nr:hypothetical protein [Bacteroides sp. Marseille-P3684]